MVLVGETGIILDEIQKTLQGIGHCGHGGSSQRIFLVTFEILAVEVSAKRSSICAHTHVLASGRVGGG